MEGIVHSGKWNKIAPVGTILLLLQFMLLPSLTVLQSTVCPASDYPNPDGICCPRCPRGFRLVEMCKGVTGRSNCTACPKGRYTDELNYLDRCEVCTECQASKHEVVKEACQPYMDTVCQCEEGYYRHYIDSTTYYCRTCRKCKSYEKQIKPCNPNNNTVCECMENYYKVKNKCRPCENCSTECEQFCKASTEKVSEPPPQNDNFNTIVGVLAVSAVMMLVLVAAVTFVVTKRLTKKRLQSGSSTDTSPDLVTKILITEGGPASEMDLHAISSSPVCEPEQPSSLPDCVPFEVKWSDLVYMVLDLVPVLKVKELVRSLGVRDMEIEQIELDYQSCREAHYQMLRVWAERGSRAGGLLHQCLLQELLVKLREMHLCRAAEELETKYGIQ